MTCMLHRPEHYHLHHRDSSTSTVVNFCLTMADVREANINVVGNCRITVLGDFNERAISLEEVDEAVNEMKPGKAPGLDEFPVECLKKRGMAVLEVMC